MNRNMKILIGIIIGIIGVFLVSCVKATTEYRQEQNIPAELTFRNARLLNDHYEKHGKEMGFGSAKEYEEAAAAVASDPKALHKTESEDGDDVYYIKATNELVIVSTDGYIRTYFKPDSGIKYFNKQ